MENRFSDIRMVGRYRLLEEIGRGAQGQVFLAEDSTLSRRVALKILSSAFAPSKESLHRFHREASAASKLDHPGICAIYEAGEAGGAHYIAMRYVEGQPLSRKLTSARAEPAAAGGETLAVPSPTARSTAPVPAPVDGRALETGSADSGKPSSRVEIMGAVHLIECAARALHAAHEAGLIHRDIKPGNIMVTREGEPVILDFGLARDETSDVDTLTQSGDLLGTPAYMSPEQLLASRVTLDRRTDIYSLGATLYECLTLSRPYDAPTRDALYQKILAADLPDPSRSNPSIPRDLKVVLATALEKDRDRRYRTALDFAEDLRRVRCYEPILARPAGPALRFQRWTQRNPVLATVILGLFVLLSSGLVVSLAFLNQIQDQKKQKEAALALKEDALDLAQKESREKEQALQAAQIERDQKGRALAEKQEALARAEGLYLSAQASMVASRNQGLALLLGLEGASLQPGLVASNILVEALKDHHELGTLNHAGRVHSARFSAAGSTLLTASDTEARIWDLASRKPLAILRGSSPATSLAIWSPDEKKVLTLPLQDDSARTWDADSGVCLAVLAGHSGRTLHGSFSPDGTKVATAGDDGQAKVFDASSGKCLLTLKAHEAGVQLADWSPDGERILIASSGLVRVETVVVGGRSIHFQWVGGETTAQIWDARDGKPLQVLGGHFGRVTAAWSRDGRRVATASEKPTSSGIRVWDSFTGAMLITLPPSTSSFASSIAFSPDGQGLLTVSNGLPRRGAEKAEDSSREIRQNLAHLWNLASGEAIALDGHEAEILSARYSPDGERVLTASRDSTARVWSARTGAPLAMLKGHEADVESAEFTLDGKRVATASADRTARVWDASGSSPYDALKSLPGAMRLSAWSRTGNRLFASSEGGIGWLIDPAGVQEPVRIRRKPFSRFLGSLGLSTTDLGDVLEAYFTPDGRKLITMAAEATDVWDAATGKLLRSLEEPASLVSFPQRAAAVSPDGRRLASARPAIPLNVFATGERGSGLRVWDLETGKVLATLPGQQRYITTVEWSPDGERILTFSPGDDARIYPAAGGADISRIKHQGGNFNSADLSPDGRLVAIPEGFASVKIWDVSTTAPAVLASIAGHADLITSISFSPDGRRVLTASRDSTAIQWSSSTGELLNTLKGHLAPLRSASFSGDGRWIVTASEDRTARVWDAAAGSEVVTYSHPGPLEWAGFSADGRWVLSITAARRAYRWPLDVVEEGIRRKPRDLASAERDRYQIGSPEERLAYQRSRQIADLLDDLEAEARTLRGLSGDRAESQAFLGDSASLLRLLSEAPTAEMKRALEAATSAARPSGGAGDTVKNPALLQFLAEVQALNGQTRDAVLTLEAAAPLPGASLGLRRSLMRSRRRLLPDLASFASIDWFLEAPELLVAEDERWRFFRGKREPSPDLEWTAVGFDDQGWEEGPGAFGYGSAECATVIGDMSGAYTTLYLRKTFELDDPGRFQGLFLSALVDDGCAIYLNGVEAGRVRAPPAGVRVPFDGLAADSAPSPLTAVKIPLEAKLFRAGRNVLAIQGFNHSKTSSDLILSLGLLGETSVEGPRGRARFDRFRAGLTAGDPRLPFLEGRLLQREGKPAEALIKLEEARAANRSAPEPFLRSAECLRAQADPVRARARVREAIIAGLGTEALWDLWFKITFLDLKEGIAEGLASLPARAGDSGAGLDLRWLLEELRSRGAIRIRAGGDDYRSAASGLLWSHDRFAARGQPFLGTFTGPIAGTADAPLYQTERWFEAGGSSLPGYHIPLPPGRYRVTLHFAEIYYRGAGLRTFDVLLEGRPVLSGYDPFGSGFATADQKKFETEVQDGSLDIEFVHRLGSPKISALEIELLK